MMTTPALDERIVKWESFFRKFSKNDSCDKVWHVYKNLYSTEKIDLTEEVINKDITSRIDQHWDRGKSMVLDSTGVEKVCCGMENEELNISSDEESNLSFGSSHKKTFKSTPEMFVKIDHRVASLKQKNKKDLRKLEEIDGFIDRAEDYKKTFDEDHSSVILPLSLSNELINLKEQTFVKDNYQFSNYNNKENSPTMKLGLPVFQKRKSSFCRSPQQESHSCDENSSDKSSDEENSFEVNLSKRRREVTPKSTTRKSKTVVNKELSHLSETLVLRKHPETLKLKSKTFVNKKFDFTGNSDEKRELYISKLATTPEKKAKYDNEINGSGINKLASLKQKSKKGLLKLEEIDGFIDQAEDYKKTFDEDDSSVILPLSLSNELSDLKEQTFIKDNYQFSNYNKENSPTTKFGLPLFQKRKSSFCRSSQQESHSCDENSSDKSSDEENSFEMNLSKRRREVTPKSTTQKSKTVVNKELSHLSETLVLKKHPETLKLKSKTFVNKKFDFTGNSDEKHDFHISKLATIPEKKAKYDNEINGSDINKLASLKQKSKKGLRKLEEIDGFIDQAEDYKKTFDEDDSSVILPLSLSNELSDLKEQTFVKDNYQFSNYNNKENSPTTKLGLPVFQKRKSSFCRSSQQESHSCDENSSDKSSDEENSFEMNLSKRRREVTPKSTTQKSKTVVNKELSHLSETLVLRKHPETLKLKSKTFLNKEFDFIGHSDEKRELHISKLATTPEKKAKYGNEINGSGINKSNIDNTTAHKAIDVVQLEEHKRDKIPRKSSSARVTSAVKLTPNKKNEGGKTSGMVQKITAISSAIEIPDKAATILKATPQERQDEDYKETPEVRAPFRSSTGKLVSLDSAVLRSRKRHDKKQIKVAEIRRSLFDGYL